MQVEHLQLGITCNVTGILDLWAHPGRAEQTLGQAVLTKWWLLRVCGPLPGRPAESGEFTMEVSFYGDPPGWWITAEWLARGEHRTAAPSPHSRLQSS